MGKFFVILALAAATFQAEASAVHWSNNAGVFRCRPAVVGHDDTLVLSKRSSALRELAVRRPGEVVPHFLVVGLPPKEMKPLMSSDQLSATSEIRIGVAELTGVPWSPSASPEAVFTIAGTYEFWLSDNLESEDGAYVCRVRYQPRGKHTKHSFGREPVPGPVL